MRPYLRNLFILSVTLLACMGTAKAQTYETAVDYLNYTQKVNADLTATYLAYLSAVSHGKGARKVEKRRQEVVNAITDSRMLIMGMPPWKGDRSLKDTTIAHLKILNIVFNEDYGKIVNMEEIAEQSYDAMEAYMLAQEKAQEKLNDAAERQHRMQRVFAEKNNITLVDGGESELEMKARIVDEVMTHANAVYLVFFKSYKQESYLMDALSKKNIVSIEQNLSSLQKNSDEGREKLKALKGYKNDASLLSACRNALNFYESEAKQGAVMTDYFLKEENFMKLKKQFESKPAGKRTQQDVDEFNKAVSDINTAMKTYNKTNEDLNKQRTAMLNEWNKTYSKYLDEYMPKQSK